MFNRSVPAAVVGTLLCISTVAVFAIALALANIDRLNERRAARRPATEASNVGTLDELSVELTIKDSATGDGVSRGTETGSSQGRESPADSGAGQEKGKVEVEEGEDVAPSVLPWTSIFSCGAETAEDETTTTATA